MKVIDVKPVENYKVLVHFENNEQRIFDVKPYICGDWYGKLNDKSYFDSVRPAGNTIEWRDGQDIAPHELIELSKAI